MKFFIFTFCALIFASNLFCQERFEREWLVGLLSKNQEDKKSSLKSLKYKIESGVSVEDAKSLILFLSENIGKINNEDIGEIFNHLHNPSHPITDSDFFDCLFNAYPKFSKESQVSIFHLILHFDHKNLDQQFIRFLEAYGNDLLFLSEQLVSLHIKDPKNISLKLSNFISNENIKISIYKIYHNYFIKKRIDPIDFVSISQKLSEDLNEILRNSKDKLIKEKMNLILLLNVASHLKIEFSEKTSKKIFALKDDEVSLALVEVLFNQDKSAPKYITDKLIRSDLFKIYLFALCEKYQKSTELIDKSLTQEDIGRDKLMCWFYDTLKIKIPAEQIVFNGFYAVGIEKQWNIPLYKFTFNIPFIKENLEFAGVGGVFKNKEDLSLLDRESVGTEFSLWNSQTVHKHVRDLDDVNDVLDETLFNTYFWSPKFDELNENNIYALKEMLGATFWLKLRNVIDFIQETNERTVTDGQQIIEVKFDNCGRIFGRFPAIVKNGKIIRSGEFNIKAIYEELMIKGKFENGLLNGEVLIKEFYISRHFLLKFIKNNLEDFQVFKDNKDFFKSSEQLIGKGLFKKELLNGTFIKYYESGKKEFECVFENGKRNGELIRYHENDKVMYKINFNKGIPKGELINYDKNGRFNAKIKFSNKWNGQCDVYYPSGKLKSQTNYLNGLKSGEERHYFENNKLKLIIPYKEGLMDGHCIFYYENGILHNTAWFKKNDIDGETVQYNIYGKLIAKAFIEDGKPKYGSYFDEKKLVLSTYKEYEVIKSELCDENGIPKINLVLYDEGDLKLLTTAILQSDIEKLKTYKENHPTILDADLGEGQNSLLLAVKNVSPNIKLVELLLQLEVELNKQDHAGNTALHIALQAENEKLIKLLIEKGALINVENKLGLTVFESLLNNPKIKIESFLNEKSYQIKFRNGQNLLHLAAKFNQVELIKSCLKNGLDINSKDVFDNSALGLAINNNRKEASELLLSLGAIASLFELVDMGAMEQLEKELNSKPSNINLTDGMENTLLHQSIKKGKLEVFQLLLGRNSDPSIKNYSGLDAISLSIIHNQPMIFDILNAKGLEIKEDLGGQRFAVHYLVMNGWDSLLKKYSDKGFSLKIKTSNEPNLLFVAVMNNQEKIIPFLIEKGLDINEKNKKGENCVQIALEMKNRSLVFLLIKHGAKIEIKEAIFLGELSLVEKLYQENIKEYKSNSILGLLHWAVDADQIEAAKFLLDKGIDVNRSNEEYFSPLRYSLQLKKLKFAELFLEKGSKDFNTELGNLKENWRVALKLGSTNILKSMINNGLELNAEVQPSIMDEFVSSKNFELVEYALKSETLIYSEKMQKKLVAIAENNKDQNMVELLKRKKTSPILTMTLEREVNYLYEVKPTDRTIKHGRFKKINEIGYLESSGFYQDNLLEGQILEFAVDSLARALGVESFASESNYKKGVLEGSKIIYYDNEKTKVKKEEFYKKGKLNGTVKLFKENGFKEAEINFENGLLHGSLKEFLEPNKLITDLVYKEGKVWSGFVVLKISDDITRKFFESYISSDYFTVDRVALKWEYSEGKVVRKIPYILKNGPSFIVDSGLLWLTSVQEETGYWDPGNFEGKSNISMKILCTNFCLLSYFGNGYSDKAGAFKRQIKNGIRWLVSVQRSDGSFVDDNSINGICAMVLSEAVGMGLSGKEIEFSATRACKFIISQQNASGGFNDFGKSIKLVPGEYDKMLPTTWCVMGLKSAMLAGILETEIQESYKKCKVLFEKVPFTNDNGINSKGHAWFNAGGSNKDSSSGGVCQGMALLTKQYMGFERDDPWCMAATKELSLFYPKDVQSIDYVQAYFQYLSLFQSLGRVDNKEFIKWEKIYSDTFELAQTKEGTFQFSWPKNSIGQFSDGGRIVSTALSVLSLSIIIRYKAVFRD